MTEAEREHGDGFLEKYGAGKFFEALLGIVEHQRLIVAALLFPLGDGLRCNTLDAKLHARHVVGRVHDEKQGESNQVHAH